jgi:hypothetical protein
MRPKPKNKVDLRKVFEEIEKIRKRAKKIPGVDLEEAHSRRQKVEASVPFGASAALVPLRTIHGRLAPSQNELAT